MSPSTSTTTSTVAASASATPAPRAPAAAAAHSQCNPKGKNQIPRTKSQGQNVLAWDLVLGIWFSGFGSWFLGFSPGGALSSVARAPRLHRGGRGFETLSAHHLHERFQRPSHLGAVHALAGDVGRGRDSSRRRAGFLDRSDSRHF